MKSDKLAGQRQKLQDALAAGASGVAVGAVRAQLVEAMIAPIATAELGDRDDICFAATGSLGRGAIAPASDVDVRFVTRGRVADLEPLIERVLYPLWDAGLQASHQILALNDAVAIAAEDLTTATSLLDLRPLAGNAELATELRARADAGLFAEGKIDELIDALEIDAKKRRDRFGGSVYLLEPDVKNGAGALRDLDVARWIAAARFKVRTGAGLSQESTWADLVRIGILLAREAREIAEAEEFLWNVRVRLHLASGRKVERLTFDAQEEMGLAMFPPPANNPGAPARQEQMTANAAERLMQDYYRCARTVLRAVDQIATRARPVRRKGRPVERDLGGGIAVFGDHTTLREQDLERDPARVLRLYDASFRAGLLPLPHAREIIARHVQDDVFCGALRASEEASKLFLDLLCRAEDAPTRSGSLLVEWHELGLLLAMVPEFAPVLGRVHHDVYHVYTVDAHTVSAVDLLRAICRGEYVHDHPLPTRLALELPDRRALFLATLLHDIGKGYPDASGSRKNHSESGAELCDVILPRFGVDEATHARVKRLVKTHLAMYHMATRRDVEAPETREELVAQVGDLQGLRDLYLLTVVDVATTAPTALTSWKASMLAELYTAAESHLVGGAVSANFRTQVRDEVEKRWSGGKRELDAFLNGMPGRYLVANSPASICSHADSVIRRAQEKRDVMVSMVPSRYVDSAELCVVADDRPGLLAKIAAAIRSARLEVLAAEVYVSTREGAAAEAVDLFWVQDRLGTTQGVEHAIGRLTQNVERLLRGEVTAQALLAEGAKTPAWATRPSPHVSTEVSVDARGEQTIVEVFAKDRPGLLYAVAETLTELGLTIVLSKINTEGSKVADVFYVTAVDGTPVRDAARVEEIRARLLRAVDAVGAAGAVSKEDRVRA